MYHSVHSQKDARLAAQFCFPLSTHSHRSFKTTLFRTILFRITPGYLTSCYHSISTPAIRIPPIPLIPTTLRHHSLVTFNVLCTWRCSLRSSELNHLLTHQHILVSVRQDLLAYREVRLPPGSTFRARVIIILVDIPVWRECSLFCLDRRFQPFLFRDLAYPSSDCPNYTPCHQSVFDRYVWLLSKAPSIPRILQTTVSMSRKGLWILFVSWKRAVFVDLPDL